MLKKVFTNFGAFGVALLRIPTASTIRLKPNIQAFDLMPMTAVQIGNHEEKMLQYYANTLGPLILHHVVEVAYHSHTPGSCDTSSLPSYLGPTKNGKGFDTQQKLYAFVE